MDKDRAKNFVKFALLEPARSMAFAYKARSANRHREAGQAASRPYRLALVSDHGAWCSDQQFNPFETYRETLATDHNITFTRYHVEGGRIVPALPRGRFDAVLVKLSYRTPEADAVAFMRDLRRQTTGAALVYMDGDDDLCIQWGEVVDIVDLYVKSHVFRDRDQYRRTFTGKSNLHEYAVQTFGHELNLTDYNGPTQKPIFIERSGSVRPEALHKIVLGWNLGLSSDILRLYHASKNMVQPEKTLDGSFRGSIKMGTITGYMRGRAREVLSELAQARNVRVSNEHLPLEAFYDELRQSRICVSPFGFGELCWRDFEAVICRAMLIKPDMSHLETSPDIFQPYRTYVPVRWDLSDLRDVFVHYAENDKERGAIADTAYAVLSNYYEEGGFIGDLLRVLRHVGFGGDAPLVRQD